MKCLRMRIVYSLFSLLFINCSEKKTVVPTNEIAVTNTILKDSTVYPSNSWQYFLQHLPIKEGPILDYHGNKLSNQVKHVAIINYDVGTTDLQQCADALMRLRAEYLFSQKRFSEIGFHFTSGDYYSWNAYCKGQRPAVRGNKVSFIHSVPSEYTHASLRKYLDIVYTYAGTISLNKELKPASRFDIGTIVITPGSPGHCFIIIDKAKDKNGKELFKLAEGYTPAQSIYVLNNPYDEDINPWYRLEKGVIETSSYRFTNYNLKKFE
jgi:hypothetical protein